MFISYYRVSTKKQGDSTLGLAAQKKAVQDFITGDKRRELIAEYTEVESGKNDARPQLQKAIDHAKKAKATLLIAKLDRLSRNVSFVFTLRDTKVDFKALDLPDANTLTVGIFATIAQHEREITSQRTKAALAVLKAKGVRLGSPENMTHKAQKLGGKVSRENAKTHKNNLQALELINDKLKSGWTYQEIADRLNKLEYKTSLGNPFKAITVRKLLERSERWNK
ncbi:recombinase family protein [Chryseolinea sp. T2]|uniref:recombinase family protein n=1 Tax=Chryseolinea sp. T2 TaxID=3129255 RepID=UPI0030777830